MCRSLHVGYIRFLISCDKRARVARAICQRTPAHAVMCNRGQLSTTLCARRRAHTLTRQTSTEASRAAQRRTELRHTVPHGAVLFLAHAAPEQMADGARKGRKQLRSRMADPGRSIQRGRDELCISAGVRLGPFAVNDNRVCQCGATSRLPDPETEDKPIKQPISMMAATLI